MVREEDGIRAAADRHRGQSRLVALAALVLHAILVLVAACWIINNGDRPDRVTSMIFARRGDARCLAPGSGMPPEAQGPCRLLRLIAVPLPGKQTIREAGSVPS